MASKLVAEICVVLKTLPTREAVTSLANKVLEEYKKTATQPIGQISCQITSEKEPKKNKNISFLMCKGLQISTNDKGFELVVPAYPSMLAADIAVQVLVTTQYQNLRKLDPTLHCRH